MRRSQLAPSPSRLRPSRRGIPCLLCALGSGLLSLACSSGVDNPLDPVDGSYQPAGDPIVRRVALPAGVSMEFVWIGSGYFTMGSEPTEEARFTDEGPARRVTLTRGFYLGRYEITQAQWEAVLGTRPWAGREYVVAGADHPAVYIAWDDVQAFADILSAVAGERFRLPTEAEWEYACRAGTRTPWWFGELATDLLAHVWYRANCWDYGFRYAQAVGTMPGNPWGLHDMHGNVQEWVQDWHGSYASSRHVDPAGPPAGTARVVRGGAMDDEARYTRSAYRSGTAPDSKGYFVGARLVLEGPAP